MGVEKTSQKLGSILDLESLSSYDLYPNRNDDLNTITLTKVQSEHGGKAPGTLLKTRGLQVNWCRFVVHLQPAQDWDLAQALFELKFLRIRNCRGVIFGWFWYCDIFQLVFFSHCFLLSTCLRWMCTVVRFFKTMSRLQVLSQTKRDEGSYFDILGNQAHALEFWIMYGFRSWITYHVPIWHFIRTSNPQDKTRVKTPRLFFSYLRIQLNSQPFPKNLSIQMICPN